MSRPPRFLENPRARALLFDPGGSPRHNHRALCPTLACVTILPSALGKTSASATGLISRLNHTARALAVYASPPRSPVVLHSDARLASGWWSSLAGRDLNPLDSIARFLSTFTSSSPRLLLAHPKSRLVPPARSSAGIRHERAVLAPPLVVPSAR